MTEGEEGFDWNKLLSDLRKSASVRAGAVLFGEAQVAYYDVLKQNMSEELAYNLLAHTTECLIRGAAEAAGPLADVMVRGAAMWGKMEEMQSDKEVPGSGP